MEELDEDWTKAVVVVEEEEERSFKAKRSSLVVAEQKLTLSPSPNPVAASSVAAPSSPPPNMPTSVLPFEADQVTLKIKFSDELVWEAGIEAEAGADEFDGYLTLQPTDLIKDDDGLIDADALRRLIKDVGGDESSVEYVAGITNLNRPALLDLRSQTEMTVQQNVFLPVSYLLYCFNPYQFTAGGWVSSGFSCSTLITEEEHGPVTYRNLPFTCMPDGALQATLKEFALATMELTSHSTGKTNSDDMFNCVLLTSMTAVALVKNGVTDKVYVPFVVNIGETGVLFVAHMESHMNAPAVKEVRRDLFHDRGKRVEFIALLAALLHKLTVLVATPKGRRLMAFLSRLPARSSAKTKSNNEGGEGGGSAKKKSRSSPATGRSGTNTGDHEGSRMGG
jgi:hypothetical protein